MADADAGRMVTSVVREGERDEIAVEEPLEIRVDGKALSVTMRTPGNDEELALGFLYGEGLINEPRAAGPTTDFAANIIDVTGPLLSDPGQRNFYTTSSCGVCGKGAIEQVAVDAPHATAGPSVARALLAALPEQLRQPGFERTGGMHATGLFSAEGELICVREDVGRHNAIDKVIGRSLLDGRWAGRSSASAGGSHLSWCRKRPLPARRSSLASVHRPRWQLNWRPSGG